MEFLRLAIVELDTGTQPVTFAGRYRLVFNGEIYNYRSLRDELQCLGAGFTTGCEAEVIAAGWHHWGPRVLGRLRGMFAFVLWDSVERRAVGARDRFGIKPLFYRAGADALRVASEPKALRESGDAVDTDALSHYFSFQYVPEPQTMTREIRQLRAGEWFTWTPSGDLTVKRYWTPEFRTRPAAEPDILAALRDSVHAHLRADVEVGAFLSGGVDSTAVVALAREINPRISTFTAVLDVPGYSEATEARTSAAALGVRNHAVHVTAEMMAQSLPTIVAQLDDPVADPALVPLYFVAKAAAERVKTVVSGEGADELFAGYPIYREPFGVAPIAALPAPLKALAAYASRVIPKGRRGRSYLDRATTPLDARYLGNARILTEREKQELLRGKVVPTTAITRPLYAAADHLGPVEQMQYVDLHTWLPGDILTKADRMSMAHGLEVRVPFLDPAVFAAAAALTTRGKLPRGTQLTKVALRDAVAPVVPPGAAYREKKGFPTPIRVWLREELYDWSRATLQASTAGRYLDLGWAERALVEHRAGRGDHSRKIWAVLVFALWLDAVARSGAVDG